MKPDQRPGRVLLVAAESGKFGGGFETGELSRRAKVVRWRLLDRLNYWRWWRECGLVEASGPAEGLINAESGY